MDKADLETYQVQLEQVKAALQADPDNTELEQLRTELEELISLTQQALDAQQASTAASSSKKGPSSSIVHSAAETWNAGDDCLAKYSADNQWYPARIISLGGSAEKRVYSIVFKGYDSTELVDAASIKPLPASQGGAAGGSSGLKRKLTKAEEAEREKKKKKNEKKLEVRAQKAKEQNNKQATWQKFAKKSEKKGIHIAGTTGTSIFKTPDNPYGKVGVTGSGKGMTEVQARAKHKFAADGSDA